MATKIRPKTRIELTKAQSNHFKTKTEKANAAIRSIEDYLEYLGEEYGFDDTNALHWRVNDGVLIHMSDGQEEAPQDHVKSPPA